MAKKITEAEYIRKFEKRTKLNRKRGGQNKLVNGHFVSEDRSGATEVEARKPGAWGSFLVTKKRPS